MHYKSPRRYHPGGAVLNHILGRLMKQQGGKGTAQLMSGPHGAWLPFLLSESDGTWCLLVPRVTGRWRCPALADFDLTTSQDVVHPFGKGT